MNPERNGGGEEDLVVYSQIEEVKERDIYISWSKLSMI
jgi:hypothetical protein